MTIDQAEKQADELIKLIISSGLKSIKVGELNIIDLDKFIKTHKSRMDFLKTFSDNWKTHYFRLYLVKKKIYEENLPTNETINLSRK